MLFDLRGRGRRRTVRVIYIGLAVLIGLGLVGFGIGGGFGGGGILSAAEPATKAPAARASPTRSRITEAHRPAAEQRQRLGKPDQGPAARSRRRSVRDARPDAHEQGQRTVRAGRRSVEPLPGAQPAQAERRTRPADGQRVRRRRPQRARAKAVRGAADRRRGATDERRLLRALARVRVQGARTRASATSPPKRPSRSRPQRSAARSKPSSPKLKKNPSAGGEDVHDRRPTAKPTRQTRAPTAPHGHEVSATTPAPATTTAQKIDAAVAPGDRWAVRARLESPPSRHPAGARTGR